MSNAIVNSLSELSKNDLIDLLLKATQPVAQDAEAEEKERCTGIAASTGEQCSRNGTREVNGEARCKSHEEWDNAEAKAKHAKQVEFVDSLKERAEKKGKAVACDNKALAAAMRAEGVKPNGNPWAKAKAAIAEGKTYEEAATVARKGATKEELLTKKAAKKATAKKGKKATEAGTPSKEDLLATIQALLAG